MGGHYFWHRAGGVHLELLCVNLVWETCSSKSLGIEFIGMDNSSRRISWKLAWRGPTVYRWPYDYSKPGHDSDFIPQDVPLSQTLSSNLLHDWEDNEQGVEAQKAYNKEHNREEEL